MKELLRRAFLRLIGSIMYKNTNMYRVLLDPPPPGTAPQGSAAAAAATAATAEENILVLGWYNRNNLGDECYKQAFLDMFPNATFACSDDVNEIPAGTDVVICGGGDIINPFFMHKIREMLHTFAGPCYGISVGIPFAADAPLFSTFDHVFVRSMTDYNTALTAIPASNVDHMPDLSWSLPQTYAPSLPPAVSTSLAPARPRLGVCLAQPVFYNCLPTVLAAIVDLIEQLTRTFDVHLIPFNTEGVEVHESDYVVNAQVLGLLTATAAKRTTNVTDPAIKVRDGMMGYIASMDLMLCMRYHSVQFSLQSRKPFVAMYTSQKVDNLLLDVGFRDSYGYAIPKDANSMPTDLDVGHVLDLVTLARGTPNVLGPQGMPIDLTAIEACVRGRERGAKEFLPGGDDTIEDAMSRSVSYLSRLLAVSPASVTSWLAGDTSLSCIAGTMTDLDAVARTLCFALTMRVSSPYVWGMTANLASSGFHAPEAIEWVYKDARSLREPVLIDAATATDVTINMTYYLQDDFKEFHRAGWSSCLTALLRFDTQVNNRVPSVLMDGYVDRTFEWASAPLVAAGIIPYTTPWVGFVHHTFNTQFGGNNCVNLFKNDLFLQSLKTCKCLIVLSQYLAAKVRVALDAVGETQVGVQVLYHPMELVDNVFSMDRFQSNPERKIVNVGAWLRNPYSIFEMPLEATWHNPLCISKAVLRGKDMGANSEPDWLMSVMDELPFDAKNPLADLGSICRPTGAAAAPESGMCRPIFGVDAPSNQHSAGLVDMVHRQHDSVQIIEKLDDAAYDDLLAQNLVFLNLIDASACNTVMECIVRTTPLIVNKHPAVVEVLGDAYPGYYQNLPHAAEMLGDIAQITAIHDYLVALPKDGFSMNTFVSGFSKLVSGLA